MEKIWNFKNVGYENWKNKKQNSLYLHELYSKTFNEVSAKINFILRLIPI